MASLAEIGERIGIPQDDLAELIELPVVADAMQSAAENPNWAPNSIWRGIGRPTLFTDSKGLDIDSLRTELVKRRELATRTTDGKIIEQRHGHPMSMGRMKKAESIARRRFDVIREVHRLFRNHYAEPQSMARVRDLLEAEMIKSEGSEP